jgi:hypothetical protein
MLNNFAYEGSLIHTQMHLHLEWIADAVFVKVERPSQQLETNILILQVR